MESVDFVHLHVHSHYSLLDGTCTIPDLVSKAVEFGMSHLALTDHGNLFGAVEFYLKCREAGITPIIGMEAYVAYGSRHDRDPAVARGGSFPHLVLLARNEKGYRNLIRLASLAHLEGFYYRPRVDKELLAECAEGLIATSACLSGEVNRKALERGLEEAAKEVRAYQEIFGPENFYLEVMDCGLSEQRDLRKILPSLSRETGAPLIATNDIHYLAPEDALAHKVHICINTRKTLEDPASIGPETNQFYFRSPLEMAHIFKDLPEAVTNTRRLAERIEFELDLNQTYVPAFHMEGVTDNRAFLRSLCYKGLKQRYGDSGERVEKARRRLEHELGVIERTGFVDYFLIVWDFVQFARNHDIPVGPGRGSAAGSVVAYCLGITQLDPLRYDLLFERFLNEERISMPDIDVDFCMERRGQVIDYVKSRYGEDRVSQIITFGTLAARQVVRDVGRVLGVPLKEVEKICKRIPATPGMTLERALQEDPELQEFATGNKRIAELFRIAPKLQGLNRNAGTHAAGVVIGDRPLMEIVPLYKAGDVISTQYTMEILEKLGLLKMDFLGLRTLTVIDLACRMIKENHGVEIRFDPEHLDDRKTYELLCRGESTAVFQLESAGMQELLRRLAPDRFEDLIALLALYRPGPLGSQMHQTYVRRKHGEEAITYPHPMTAPILEETKGVILYQEQVMRIANVLAGFSMTEADNLRKAMGKKKMAIMATFREKFVEGAVQRGVDRQQASDIFDLMAEFAKYGFNKSHSAAYAYITYQTAYLKANWPAEFMAAVLSCEMAHTDKVAAYLEECRRLGIPVRGPDINESQERFTVRDGAIVYALTAVKNVGQKPVREIIKRRGLLPERRFASLFHLCEELGPHVVTRSLLENLTKAGAFDSFCPDRARVYAAIDAAIARGAARSRDRAAGQLTFDDLLAREGKAAVQEEPYPEVPPWPESQKLAYEKEVLGLYLSGHPLTRHRELIRALATISLSEMPTLPAGRRVLAAGAITGLQIKNTERGTRLAVMILEDLTGRAEAVAYDETYRNHKELIAVDRLVFVTGRIQERNDRKSISCDRIIPLEEAPEALSTSVAVVVDLENSNEHQLFALKRILKDHPGRCPVRLIFKKRNQQRALAAGPGLAVKPDGSFIAAVRDLLGEDRVRFCTEFLGTHSSYSTAGAR